MPRRGQPLKCALACERSREPISCPLYDMGGIKTRGVPSYKYGSHPDLFIVAEAPGKDEDAQGEPMVGASGRILWKMLNLVGINSCYIGNAIRCRPPKNRDPESYEMQACGRHTLQDLKRADPQVVLLAGAVAANWYLKHQRKPKALKDLKGWRDLSIGQGENLQAFVTNHPSYLLRNADAMNPMLEDLHRVKRMLDGQADAVEVKYKWAYINTRDKLATAIDNTLSTSKPTAFDFECLAAAKINVEPISLAWGWMHSSGHARVYTLPLQHPQTPWTPEDWQWVLKQLRRLWSAKARLPYWIAHNSKFEYLQIMDMLTREGKSNFVISNAPVVCTMQNAHAVDENRKAAGGGLGVYSMDALSSTWLGVPQSLWSDEVNEALYETNPETGKNRGHEIDIKKICHHDAKDVAVTLLLDAEEKRRAKDEHWDIERLQPLLSNIPYLLASIERNGMPVSLQRLAQLRSNTGPLRARREEIHSELSARPSCQEAVKKVRGNVKALFAKGGVRKFPFKREYEMALFFDVLGLEPTGHGKKVTERWPKGEPSIDKNFFGTYKDLPECKLVQEYKQLKQLENTFLDNWWEFAHMFPDNRIRADIRGTGTNTGRLSMADPNLQQIPSGRNPAAKKVKGCFMPVSTDSQLNVIISADYSQAEVRWLAQISQERVLIDMFVQRHEMLRRYASKPSKALMKRIEEECDLHRSTAAEVFGVSIQDVTSLQRQGAKSVTFGLIYGQTEYGLAANLGIDLDEAVAMRDKWLGRFKQVNKWFDHTEGHACKHGWVESLIGRRRHLPILRLFSGKQFGHNTAVNHAKRVSRNSVIQSIASDMTLWLAIKLQKYIDLHNLPWKILTLVHDSILVELPVEDAMEYITVSRELAHSPDLLEEFGVEITCPMELEHEIGYSYGEGKTLTPSPVENERDIGKLIKHWEKVGASGLI